MHSFTRAPDPITCSDPGSLQRDERDHSYRTPKYGFRALRHQERRRREFRQNSRALRSAALQRAREALSGDLHEEETSEVGSFPALLLVEGCACQVVDDRELSTGPVHMYPARRYTMFACDDIHGCVVVK